MPRLPAGSGQDAALAVLEDRFQPNMPVSDTGPMLCGLWWEAHPGIQRDSDLVWRSRKVTAEWKLRGQWSEGKEVLFKQITVSAKALDYSEK